MARITIEDCMEKVPNRFQLVQMAAIRAKQLKRGATAFLDKGDNKEVVTALREIAAGIVVPDFSEIPDIDPRFETHVVPSRVEALQPEPEPIIEEAPEAVDEPVVDVPIVES
jgi:DNA-directed RNA polymerase subunit omega